MANGQRTTMDVLSNEQLVQLGSMEIFRNKHIIAENCPFQLYKFNSFGLRKLFPCDVELPFIGVYELYVDVTRFSNNHVDHTQEEEKYAQGTLQHLLDSDQATDGNIISTGRVPSEYPPPGSLASDATAWDYTADEPHCKRRIQFPQGHTRWITAATRNAFGAWTEEAHGFCTYINVVNGSLWILVGKPKAQGGRIFANISTPATLFDPIASNSQLWDVEAVLLGEGSQM